MGCSISRLDTLLAKAIEQHPSSSSSFTSSSLSKSHSLSTPLVHHPPLSQGDTTHLVFLTSSSYGSLILNDHSTPPPPLPLPLPPIEVINTWELMEGLEEVDNGVKIGSCEPQKILSSSLGVILCNNGLKIGSCEPGSASLSPQVGVLSDYCDFVESQKVPSSSLGLNLCDNGEKIGSCEPGSTMEVDLSDFIEPQKLPSSSLGLNLCENGEKVGFCEPGSIMGVDLSDVIETQKIPGSSLELNLCDDGEKIGFCDLGSIMGVDLSDFSEPQKRPGSSLGLNLCENVKNLNDSYVFVEMPKRENGGNNLNLNLNLNSKPLWKLLSEESLLSKMDHNVVSSNQNMFPSRRSGCDQPKLVSSKSYSGLVSSNGCKLNGCEDKIVFYYTSLRGIRRTYEDCCTSRMILRGFRVVVDERDISMDSSYKNELQLALGGKIVSLPQLFVGGRHIGGVDEIKRLHESGELEKSLDGFPIQDRGFACDGCGESRFIPCLTCNGSRKLFNEEEGRMRRCPECNENGLVRCPGCC